MQRIARMKRELQLFSQSPPHGISCWAKSDNIEQLEAQIIGGDGTPYEGGIFKLDIQVPERYPFEPPKVKFVTPIYHPNIDNAGRICLDSLKMPPKGAWKPALNISTVLTSVQLLMAEPNPEDPLMTDISNEFKFSRPSFIDNAKEWTRKYAMDKTEGKENCGTSGNARSQLHKQTLGSDESSSESESEEEMTKISSVTSESKKRLTEGTSDENCKKLKC